MDINSLGYAMRIIKAGKSARARTFQAQRENYMTERRNTKTKQTRAFARGITAYRAGKRLMDCPYRTEKTAKQWALGWVEGMRRHTVLR